MATDENSLVDDSCSVSAAYWADFNELALQGGIFSFTNREYLYEPMESRATRVCAMKATGGGFPVDIKTPIPTPDGWVLMENIKVGDKVFGSDGRTYTVKFVHPIKYNKQCYRVIFSDKSSIICDGDHLWTLTDMWHYRYVKQVTIKTSDMFLAKKRNNRNRYVLGIAKSLELPEKELPIDPYVFGLWLGDGNSYSNQITCGVTDSSEYDKILKQLGIDFEIRHRRNTLCGEYRNIKLNGYCPKLRLMGVLKNKHIPMIYLRASYQQRLELLRGLMDTDGHITKTGKCEFYNTNTILLTQVKELILSLGFKAVLSAKGFSTNWDKTKLKDYKIYRILFKVYNDVPIAKLKRKKENQIDRNAGHPTITERRRIIGVVPIDSVPVRCITVNSPDHLFLAGEDFISVHNSECMGILPSIHGMIYGRYPQGVLYMFPTNDDVRDFSKSRFTTLITENRSAIGRYVKSGGVGTDSAGLKKVGNAFLYLRGARLNPGDEGAGAKFSTKLTGIQVDRIVPDEIDQMDSEAIAKARGRMGNACVDGVKGRSEERYIANPSDEDRGIDLYWQVSDQREWFVKCASCGAYTCALRQFINNPEKSVGFHSDGKGYIRCSKCEKPIGNAPGKWVAGKPSVKDLEGYQWNHLWSVYHDPGRILRDFTNPPEGNLGDVYRLDLGLPYSSAEDKLQKDVVLRCCGNDIMPERHDGPCAMGVDVKKVKHVVIGIRTGRDRYEILKVAEVQSFKDVHDLARRYNVKSGVVDIRPYEDEARQFQKSESYKVFLCEYTESPLQEANFNDNTGVVKAYRTGIFDASHRVIVNGQVRLPRRCKAVEDFAIGCCKCVKSKETNKRTRQIVYRYRKTGDRQDDYRNALNYFLLAARGGRIRTVSPYGGGTKRLQKFAVNKGVKL